MYNVEIKLKKTKKKTCVNQEVGLLCKAMHT
jgi:hypothetical protein